MKPTAPAPVYVFTTQAGLWDPVDQIVPTLFAEDPPESSDVDEEAPDAIPFSQPDAMSE